MATDNAETYTTSWVTGFFHDFPHINFEFTQVNSTFDPTHSNYQQALVFWALVPVVLCFTFWLVFLFYFIFQCCQRPNGNKSKMRSTSCSRVLTGLFMLIGVSLIALGFYQNENAHRSVCDVKHSVIDVNNTVMTAAKRVDTLNILAEDVADRISGALAKAASEITNETVRLQVTELVNNIRKDASSAQQYLDKIKVEDTDGNFDNAVSIADDVEYFRWLITIAVFCLYIFIYLMCFIGLLMRSKATLIVCAAVAVICSLFIWLATGVYMSASVALGDLCNNPDDYFIGLAQGTSGEVAVRAYIKCTDQSQPYQEDILAAQQAVSSAISSLDETVKLATPFHIKDFNTFVMEMRNDLQYSTGNLSTLLNNVGMCTTLHNYYVNAINASCNDTIAASALLALVCCLVGLCCTVMIFTISCLWKQYGRKRLQSEYVPVDDTDPFLPRPPPYESDYGTMGHSSTRPWSERSLQHHSSTSRADDEVMMLTHHHHYPTDDSPPPAYHPGQYVKQYVDSGPTPNSMRSQSNH